MLYSAIEITKMNVKARNVTENGFFCFILEKQKLTNFIFIFLFNKY